MTRKKSIITAGSSWSNELPRCDRSTDIVTTAQLLNRRIDHIEQTLQKIHQNCGPTDYFRLNSIDRFYVYCVLLASEKDGTDCELPCAASLRLLLAPTIVLTREVYSKLYEKRILIPNLYSPISAFNIASAGTEKITFDSSRVHWTLSKDTLGSRTPNLISRLKVSLIGLRRDDWARARTLLLIHEYVNKVLDASPVLKRAPEEALITDLVLKIKKYADTAPGSIIQSFEQLASESHAFKKALRGAPRERISEKITAFIEKHMKSIPPASTPYVINDGAEYLRSSNSVLARELQYFVDTAI